MSGTTGLILGKFHPPTLGHVYLVDFARHYAGRLTVVVGTLAGEQIPAALRVAWMREMFPDVNVVHLADENPQFPEEHPDFWHIWRTSLRRLVPAGPDFVFASEPYGFRLAEELGARYVPVDHLRELRPISGTAVRNDPMRHWRFIPPAVRPYFVRRVAVVGPESTGKTTLAKRLAAHFDTVVVAEYARGLIDVCGGEVRDELFPMILAGQRASEEALARQANRVLICDSEAFTTRLYRQLYLGDDPQYLREAAERTSYACYLLADPDTPYVPDPQRQHPDRREWFYRQFADWLSARGARYTILRGSWDERFTTACAAVDALIAERPRSRPG